MLASALQQERVTEEEVRAAVRAEGMTSLEEAGAVVLQTDGSFTVLPRQQGVEASALSNVRGYGEGTGRSG